MRNTLSPRSGWSTPDARIHALFVSESTWEAGLQVRLMNLIYLLLPEPPRMYNDLFWYFCYYFGAETFFSATQILLFCIFSSIYTIYSLQFFFFFFLKIKLVNQMCLWHPVELYELLHRGLSRDRETFCGTNLLEEMTWNLKLPLKLTTALFMGLKRGCKSEDQVAFPSVWNQVRPWTAAHSEPCLTLHSKRIVTTRVQKFKGEFLITLQITGRAIKLCKWIKQFLFIFK